MTRPYVFISYSHKDETEKEQLLSHLGVLQRAGLIEVWSDDRIGAGADWETEISRAIAQARVAILLISANFLNSDFILGQEVPSFLKRREGEGLVVFPVIAKACAWRTVTWLARLNSRPKNGRPIWGASDSHVDHDLAAIAEEVAQIVNTDTSEPSTTPFSPQADTTHHEIPNTLIHWPDTGFEHLKSQFNPLVQMLYPEAQEVMVERELGGGFGGATVLLVQPIGQHGRANSRQIVKLGPDVELRQERENSVNYIEKDLSTIAPRFDNYVIQDDLAAISYIFVGEGVLGQTQSLEEYYQNNRITTVQITQTLKQLLDDALGQRWYSQTRPYPYRFAQEYGPHLAEHLRLRIRLASADSIWPANQPPSFSNDYRQLAVDAIVTTHQEISPSTLIHLDGLTIKRVKHNELKFQHPTHPGVVVKVECLPDSKTHLAFSPGDKVGVRGEVIYNRPGRLEEIVQMAFSGFSEASVDVNQETLNWDFVVDQYPNPLHIYPTILNQPLQSRKSLVHGDLHLRNILVDQAGRGWLIDFARVTERHNIFDFIKLETYIRQMILSQENYHFSFADYLQFEETLVATSLGQPVSAPDQPDLQKAFQVIQSIREIAAHYMGYPADFYAEYLPGLFLYNLAVLKYFENHGAKAARLAFATAAVVGRALTQDKPEPKPEPTAKQKIEIFLKGDFSSLSTERRSAAIDALAAIMGITSKEIEIYSVSPGSIIFKLGVPSTAVEQFRLQLEANNAQLRLLNVEKAILHHKTGEIEEWVVKKGRFNLISSPNNEVNSQTKSQIGNIFKGLTMKPIQYIETAKLLAEAITSAHTWETQLGSGRKGKAEKAFEALRNGQIKLDNPEAFIQRLRPKDFEGQNIQLSPEIKKSMQGKDGYGFYLMRVPILLYPGRGAQYRLLESQFTFRAINSQRPLGIQNIFPKPIWKPVLDWGGDLELALDGGLDWGANVDQIEAKIAKLGGELAGRVGNKNKLSSFIKLPAFEYTLGRMEIEAQFSASTASWRLDSKRLFRTEDRIQLVLLLKIPKEVKRIRIEAVAQAEVSFSWLTAQIEHVYERLPKTIQQIVKDEKGLPLQDFQTWSLYLPD